MTQAALIVPQHVCVALLQRGILPDVCPVFRAALCQSHSDGLTQNFFGTGGALIDKFYNPQQCQGLLAAVVAIHLLFKQLCVAQTVTNELGQFQRKHRLLGTLVLFPDGIKMISQGRDLVVALTANPEKVLQQFCRYDVMILVGLIGAKRLLQSIQRMVIRKRQQFQQTVAILLQPAGFHVAAQFRQIGGIVHIIKHDEIQRLLCLLPGVHQDTGVAQLMIQCQQAAEQGAAPIGIGAAVGCTHGHNDLVVAYVVGILIQIHADIVGGTAQRILRGVPKHLDGTCMKFMLACQPVEEYVEVGHIQTLIYVDQKTKAILHNRESFLCISFPYQLRL